MEIILSTNIWWLLFSLFGGLGLILLGLRFLSESLQFLCGGVIRWALNIISKNAVISIVAGAVVALFVQSGIATTFMAVSYSSSGLLSLSQLMAFLLGSNLGTSFTSVIFLLPRGYMEYYFLGLGALPMFYAPQEWLSQMGRSVFALGLLLVGYNVLSEGFDYSSVTLLTQANGPHESGFWWIILAAVVFSAVIRSSVASIAIIMAALGAQAIALPGALAMVLGVNVGTALPVFLATQKVGTSSKQGSFFHLLSNFLGALLAAVFFREFMIICGGVAQYFGNLKPSLVLYLPISQVVFNLGVVVIFGALIWPFKQLIVLMFPQRQEGKEIQQLKLLGHLTHVTPALALEQAYQEVKKMSAMVETILHLTHDMVTKGHLEQDEIDRIVKYEDITDNVQLELTEYLREVMSSRLSHSQSGTVQALLRLTHELESIADKARFIVHRHLELDKTDVVISEQAKKHLAVFFEAILADYELVFVRLTEAQAEPKEEEKDPLAKFNSDGFTSNATNELFGMQQLTQNETTPSAQAIGDMLIALTQIRLHTQNVFQAYRKL